MTWLAIICSGVIVHVGSRVAKRTITNYMETFLFGCYNAPLYVVFHVNVTGVVLVVDDPPLVTW